MNEEQEAHFNWAEEYLAQASVRLQRASTATSGDMQKAHQQAAEFSLRAAQVHATLATVK